MEVHRTGFRAEQACVVALAQPGPRAPAPRSRCSRRRPSATAWRSSSRRTGGRGAPARRAAARRPLGRAAPKVRPRRPSARGRPSRARASPAPARRRRGRPRVGGDLGGGGHGRDHARVRRADGGGAVFAVPQAGLPVALGDRLLTAAATRRLAHRLDAGLRDRHGGQPGARGRSRPADPRPRGRRVAAARRAGQLGRRGVADQLGPPRSRPLPRGSRPCRGPRSLPRGPRGMDGGDAAGRLVGRRAARPARRARGAALGGRRGALRRAGRPPVGGARRRRGAAGVARPARPRRRPANVRPGRDPDARRCATATRPSCAATASRRRTTTWSSRCQRRTRRATSAAPWTPCGALRRGDIRSSQPGPQTLRTLSILKALRIGHLPRRPSWSARGG